MANKFFTVIVDQSELSTQEHHLDMVAGDVLIVTHWNKLGWWWGVSAFDSSHSGWFKSSLTQPYTGELPEGAQSIIDELVSLERKIPAVPAQSSGEEVGASANYAQRVALSLQGASTNRVTTRSDVVDDYFDERQWLEQRNKRVKR